MLSLSSLSSCACYCPDNIMHAAAARLAAAAPTAVLTVALTGEGQPMSLTQRLRSSEMLEAAVQRRRRDTSSKSNGGTVMLGGAWEANETTSHNERRQIKRAVMPCSEKQSKRASGAF